MDPEFKTSYLDEPKLLFNDNGESYNPCIGLIKFGPRFSGSKNVERTEYNIGIIGSSKTISQTRNVFEGFQYKILPSNDIKPWRIPFPGLNDNSPLRFTFNFDPKWEEKISIEEFAQIKKQITMMSRAEFTLSLIEKKLTTIYDKESPPDLVIISLPEEIFALCTRDWIDKPMIKVKDDDFHNRIKIRAMELKLPTQLIRPETLIFKGTQERYQVAWNLVVGMLYKCQKGHPWKLTHLEDGTCYVGISFFQEKGKKTRRASMAQIFLDTGESFVLRGDSFSWNHPRHPKSPHLSEENAKNIMNLVLDHYKQHRGSLPKRMVVHKSSHFWDDELKGFLEATDSISERDFITILNSNIRYFTPRSFPILRGTLIEMDEKHNYLFTTGFVPSLNTYPGLSIPSALWIRPYHMDTDVSTISKEILAFTKLDWNNTFVYSKFPVTISVSRKVGNIMSETTAQNIDNLDPHYYFYM